MAELLWRCDLCSDLVLRRVMKKHLQERHEFTENEAHQVEVDVTHEAFSSSHCETSLVPCPLCEVEVMDHVGLARHCERRHRDHGANGEPQDYSVFTKCFASYSKYEKWLAEQCDRTCTKFTHRVKHNGTLLQLRCDTPIGNPGERRARICSCFLNVRLKEVGPIVVHGCFGHAGHKLDLTLRSLSVDEELFLKGLLEENSVDRTLGLLEGDSCLKASRLALITRKDLCIIVEKYNLSPVPSAPDMMSPLVSDLESKPDCGFSNTFDQEDCKKNVLDLGSRKRPAVNALEAEDTSDCENQGDVIDENHDTCLLAVSLMSNDSPSSSLQTEASPEIQEQKDSLQMELKDEGNFSIDTKSDVADEMHSNVGIPVIELIKIEEEKVSQKPAKLEV